MSLKSRKAKHRAFRDALRERKRLRKQRREIAQPLTRDEILTALDETKAILAAAAECYEQAKRRKRGKAETEKLYIAHMVKRGYSETEARMALAAGEASRA